MRSLHLIFSVLIMSIFVTGCGSYFNQPVMQQEARVGEVTKSTKKIKELPLPEKKIVVGVYNFKDQTGQYKNVENGSTFSTAVSQGGTSMLVQALEDSKWFTPIERENLSNLLNERNIIRNTRKEYKKNNKKGEPNLPPLLYAGVLLEGGIVSYDSNIITGGLGARYFGVGASTQYREDRITVYLRAVSTSNGRILKTVYVSKTVLSQAVDASLFRYVNFQRLLEVETGYTKNEPVQLAMKDAIEKAVQALVIEGIQEGLWNTKKGEVIDNILVKEYMEDKKMEESKLLYNRPQTERNLKNSFSFVVNTPMLYGDYNKKRLGFGGAFGYARKVNNYISANANVAVYSLETGQTYSRLFFDTSFNAETVFLPYDNVTPYVYGGFGYLFDAEPSSGDDFIRLKPVPKVQMGIGIMVYAKENLAVKLFAEGNFTFSDELDLLVNGKRDDYFLNFGIGINYFFGKSKEMEQIINSDLIKE